MRTHLALSYSCFLHLNLTLTLTFALPLTLGLGATPSTTIHLLPMNPVLLLDSGLYIFP